MIPERLIRVKPNETQSIQRKCDVINFFAKISASKSTEKKIEVTQVPPPKKMKKENKVKKKGKERPKKRRIKRTIIALENLKSLLKPTSKEQILQSVRAFYQRAFKFTLNNLPYSDELLNHAEVINWEYRKDATIDRITYFVQR